MSKIEPAIEKTLQAVRIVIENIRQKAAFDKADLPQLNLHDDYARMVDLLILLRNSLLASSPPSRLSILQQLTITIADLGPLSEPAAFLAKFDRRSFRRECLTFKDAQYRFLSCTVFGIYPPKNMLNQKWKESKILELDQESALNNPLVGNASWEKTRYILEQFYVKAASENQKRCLEILLCKKELLNSPYMKDPWYQLWATFYQWTIQCFLEKEEPQLSSIQQKLKDIESILKEKQSPLHLLIYYVFKWVTDQFLLSSKPSKEDTLQCLQRFSSKFQREHLPEEVIVTLLLKDCFIHSNISEDLSVLDQRMSNIQDHLHQATLDISLKNILLSYILPINQLVPFLQTNQMPFWKYPLSPTQKQSFAREYLSQTLPQEYWKEVLIHLSGKDIKNYLLPSPQKWITKSWRFTFLELFSDPSSVFLEKMSESYPNLSSMELIKSMSYFCEQWKLYLGLESETRVEQKIKLLERILTFDLESCESFRKIAQFPQDQEENFVDCCLQHVNLLSSSTKRFNGEKCCSLMMSFEFARNLNRFTAKSSQKWGNYWSSWSCLLINSNQIMRGLLSIQPEGHVLDDEEAEL